MGGREIRQISRLLRWNQTRSACYGLFGGRARQGLPGPEPGGICPAPRASLQVGSGGAALRSLGAKCVAPGSPGHCRGKEIVLTT